MIAYLIPSNGQIIASVHIFSSVEHRFLSAKDFRIGLNHSFDNLSIYLSRTLIGCNSDVVVMKKTSRHCYLKVIRAKRYYSAVSPDIRSSRTHK